MQYMLLVRVPPDARPTAEEADPTDWNAEAERRMGATGLHLADPPDATTVRVRNGRTLITDGPFAEFKEYIAGFSVIDAPDLDAALELAQRHPVAGFGAVEVRELWPF